MKNFGSAFILLLAIMLLLPSFESKANPAACGQGEAAFQDTVFRKLRRDCRSCHKAGGEVPAFADAVAADSYRYLLPLVDFGDIPRSLLVERAGNGHCKIAKCDAESGREMAELVQDWWTRGQQDCNQGSALRSGEMELPGNESVAGEFIPLSVDLGATIPEFAGVRFKIEVERFTDSNEVNRGSYRFRKPRFIGGQRAIHVKDLQLFLNGRQLPYGTGFSDIDVVVSPVNADARSSNYPTLSAQTVLLLDDGKAPDKLQVGFGELRFVRSQECENLESFTNLVAPKLIANQCTTCHGGSGSGADPRAQSVFNLEGPSVAQCKAVAERVHSQGLRHSPLLAVPTRGLFGHPELPESERISYFQALKDWATK